jgi:hypothetical protein
MASQADRCTRLVLCRKQGLGKITVEMESFFDFSFKLSEDLQDLIAEHRLLTPTSHSRDARRRRRPPCPPC